MFGCGYCNNAFTDEELTSDDDLSYIGIDLKDNTFRVFFRSGDGRKTGFIFETFDGRWQSVGSCFPNFCPFCARALIENRVIKRND